MAILNRPRTTAILILVALGPLPACARPTPAGFVNRVWSVSQSSSVAPGTLYVFPSDSTVVITSPGNKPAVGKWEYDGAGMTMIEEGIPYKVEILEVTIDRLRIRSHNPGTPVDIMLVPAPVPLSK